MKVTGWQGVIVCVTTLLHSALGDSINDRNLTCYQCNRYNNTPCGPESLLPCPPVSDRCVTHISQDAQRGYVIKRECGLGPCGFNDDLVNKGLGLDGCDRSRPEYFCVFCCSVSGCNKSIAPREEIHTLALILMVVSCLLYHFL